MTRPHLCQLPPGTCQLPMEEYMRVSYLGLSNAWMLCHDGVLYVALIRPGAVLTQCDLDRLAAYGYPLEETV